MPVRWPHDTLGRQLVVWGGLMIAALLATYTAAHRSLALPVHEVWSPR